MATRICPDCSTAWPADRDFDECPDCGVRTQRNAVRSPSLTPIEAKARRFEAYYRRHDAERERRGDPSPDVVGRLEARALLRKHRAEINALEAGA